MGTQHEQVFNCVIIKGCTQAGNKKSHRGEGPFGLGQVALYFKCIGKFTILFDQVHQNKMGSAKPFMNTKKF